VRRLIFTTAAATLLGGAALADNISVTGPVPTPEGFVVTVHNPPKARPGLIAADGTPTPCWKIATWRLGCSMPEAAWC